MIFLCVQKTLCMLFDLTGYPTFIATFTHFGFAFLARAKSSLILKKNSLLAGNTGVEMGLTWTAFATIFARA